MFSASVMQIQALMFGQRPAMLSINGAKVQSKKSTRSSAWLMM